MDNNYYRRIVESLRKGVPPKKGVKEYSVGHEALLDGIKNSIFKCIADTGIIRFVNGSWGSGKTHLFRLLAEIAYKEGMVVSNVELNANSTVLNKFNTIFAEIIRQIKSPLYYEKNDGDEFVYFHSILSESYYYHCCGRREKPETISPKEHETATKVIMNNRLLDLDFKKMICAYWNSLKDQSSENAQIQDEVIQWFCGEGSIGQYRKKYGISKIINKDNSKLMLQSLVNFIKISGYKGLLILFDEAEQYYSVIRKSELRQAHNNLLALINNIESLNNLILIYATTPDFFVDPQHGIQNYGALAGRIGRPDNKQPRALDMIWNLDAVSFGINDYIEAAKRIRDIFAKAYPETQSKMADDNKLKIRVEEISQKIPNKISSMRFWRIFVKALVEDFTDYVEGSVRKAEDLTADVIKALKEEQL